MQYELAFLKIAKLTLSQIISNFNKQVLSRLLPTLERIFIEDVEVAVDG